MGKGLRSNSQKALRTVRRNKVRVSARVTKTAAGASFECFCLYKRRAVCNAENLVRR